MSDRPTQTTPKGAEIPVPDRDDVLAAFRKIVDVPPRDDEAPEEDSD